MKLVSALDVSHILVFHIIVDFLLRKTPSNNLPKKDRAVLSYTIRWNFIFRYPVTSTRVLKYIIPAFVPNGLAYPHNGFRILTAESVKRDNQTSEI
jgi:hypothetical protein